MGKDRSDTVSSVVLLIFSLYCTFSLVSPPFNSFNDYLFTSSNRLPNTITPRPSNNKTSVVYKGRALYDAIHKGKSQRSPLAREILRVRLNGKDVIYEVTSGFGPRWGRMHRGVDIGMVEKTPLHNPTNMKGKATTFWDYKGGGTVCLLELINSNGEASGLKILYLHMTSCKVGDIEPYGLIGLSGNTGLSQGPHLHLSIKAYDNHIPASASISKAVIGPKEHGLKVGE